MTEDDSKTRTAQPKLWTAVFVSIVAVALCCFIVGQGLNSGTSVYLSRVGGTATLAGIGAAVFSAAAAAARIVGGPVADTRSRFIVILVGGVFLLAGTLGQALAPSLDLFVLWRTLQGIGFGGITTAAATAAADVLPAERLGEGIGYYGLGQALAMSIGPALALFLVATDSAENLFLGLSVPAAAAIVIALTCRYERDVSKLPKTSTYRVRVEQRQAREAAASQGSGSEAGTGAESPGEDSTGAKEPFWTRIFEPKALVGAIPMTVMSPVFGFGIFFCGLFGTSLGAGNAGLFYTISAVAMVVIRLASKSFMDRTAPIKIFAVAVGCGVVYTLMMLAASLGVAGEGGLRMLFYLGGIPYGLCLGMAMPINQSVSVKNSPSARWGAANGLFLLLYDIGIGTASALWGVTNDLFGFTFTLACVLVFAVLSLASAFLTYPPADKKWR